MPSEEDRQGRAHPLPALGTECGTVRCEESEPARRLHHCLQPHRPPLAPADLALRRYRRRSRPLQRQGEPLAREAASGSSQLNKLRKKGKNSEILLRLFRRLKRAARKLPGQVDSRHSRKYKGLDSQAYNIRPEAYSCQIATELHICVMRSPNFRAGTVLFFAA